MHSFSTKTRWSVHMHKHPGRLAATFSVRQAWKLQRRKKSSNCGCRFPSTRASLFLPLFWCTWEQMFLPPKPRVRLTWWGKVTIRSRRRRKPSLLWLIWHNLLIRVWITWLSTTSLTAWRSLSTPVTLRRSGWFTANSVLLFREKNMQKNELVKHCFVSGTMDILFRLACQLLSFLSDDDASHSSVIIRVLFVWFVCDGSSVMTFFSIGCLHALCWSGHWDTACEGHFSSSPRFTLYNKEAVWKIKTSWRWLWIIWNKHCWKYVCMFFFLCTQTEVST